MLLGCIGDDFTGSTDLGNTLARGGMRVTQYCRLPDAPAEAGVEAGIVALKSRTIPPADAVARSLDAAEWLLAQGCRQLFFKYCSTFDSTPQGNIGPVIDALMERLGADVTVVCPAFPATGRSVYQGHLFVQDRLLNESGMQHHPLTPMTDADIRRWLAPQTKHRVGHVPAGIVLQGPAAIARAVSREAGGGRRVVVVDAVRDEDLHAIGRAGRSLKLITGGSGVALGLPENFRADRLRAGEAGSWAGSDGPAAILSGSCSKMTRAQVARYARMEPAFELVPEQVMDGTTTAAGIAEWALAAAREAPPLVYSSAEPAVVEAAQARFGREALAGAIESLFADLARRLAEAGVTRLVVAGGETSGAVVEALGLDALQIGPEIAPGVPAVKASGRPLWLALKSGNFGDESFFAKALLVLRGDEA